MTEYMGHSEGCGCSECYVMRGQRPVAPVAQPIHEQQTLELSEPELPLPIAATALTVALTAIVQLPPLPWACMTVVGAGRLDLAQEGAEVVAIIAVNEGTNEQWAVWWDRNVRKLVASRVAIANAQIEALRRSKD